MTDTATERMTVETTDDLVMTMLHDHVPLSLICDLRSDGPPSAEILATEGSPTVAWWVQ
jgi:hypothetical protein